MTDRSSHLAWQMCFLPPLVSTSGSGVWSLLSTGIFLLASSCSQNSSSCRVCRQEWSPASEILVFCSAFPTQLSGSITAIPLALAYPQTTRAHFPRNCGCPQFSSLHLSYKLCFTNTALSRTEKVRQLSSPCMLGFYFPKEHGTRQFLFTTGGKQLPRQPVLIWAILLWWPECTCRT